MITFSSFHLLDLRQARDLQHHDGGRELRGKVRGELAGYTREKNGLFEYDELLTGLFRLISKPVNNRGLGQPNTFQWNPIDQTIITWGKAKIESFGGIFKSFL